MNVEEFLAMDLDAHFGMTLKEACDRREQLQKDDPACKRLDSIIACHSVRSNLKRGRRPGRHTDIECGSCGSKEVYCEHIDEGVMDYYDEFWHICMNCLDASYDTNFTMAGYETGNETINCPFCGHHYEVR